ncbi:MAG: GntR family transcriptional regulator [Spirochaetaceae bacterium]|nr:GntR family transcriptional regulator [Spirochaetaceae bacterium]
MKAMIEYEDLSEKVYRSIKTMILEGELEPGEKLRQEELALRLGISRTPLAAAFSKLEKEMLVELLPRRGARVRTLSSEELLDLYEIRMRLEPLGAFEAAQVLAGARPSPIDPDEGRRRLEEALARYRTAVATEKAPTIKLADYDFHLAIVELSGNEPLRRLITSSNIVFISNQRGLLKAAGVSLAEHEALVAAIAEGAPDRAEAVMEAHLAGARVSLAKRVAEEGGAP